MLWYLSRESLPLDRRLARETDLVQLTGLLSDELVKLGRELGCALRRTRASSVVLLLGAGGAVIYFLSQGRRPPAPRTSRRGGSRQQRFRQRSLWSWLFEEELVEDFSKDAYFLHSHYFGPAAASGRNHLHPPPRLPSYLLTDSDGSADRKCAGLNGLWAEDRPKKFLKRPLYDIRQRGETRHLVADHSGGKLLALPASINTNTTPVHISNPCPRCVKGTCRLKKHQHQLILQSSCSSSNYSGSPPGQHKVKTSTPDPEDLRAGLMTATTHHHHRPERLSGDGSDETATDSSDRLQDDLARFSGTPVGFLKDQYRPTYRLYGCRGAPDGKERYSASPSVSSRCSSPSSEARDSGGGGRSDSLDSDGGGCSMTGSMVELVANAREVRRLIRETSFDSTASDFSLDLSLHENLGASTADGLEGLCRGLDRLVDNCETIDLDMAALPPAAAMVTSKSTMSGLSQYTTEGEEEADSGLIREGSIPDLRDLQRTLRQNKGLWKLTNFSGLSDRSRQASIVSDTGSFEWDSPVHGWSDMKVARVPLAAAYHSSSVSESGDEVGSLTGSLVDPWEWDDVNYSLAGEEGELEVRLAGHRSWLPEFGAELDLETELRLRELSTASSAGSASTSARSSLDRDMFVRRRLPPSGRSSVTRESRLSVSSRGSSASDDVTITAPLVRKQRSRSRSRESLLTTSKTTTPPSGLPRSTSLDWLEAETGEGGSSLSMDSSVDTGISSMNSSVCSTASSSLFVSGINLSPVKEAGEPPTSPAHSTPTPASSATNSPSSPEMILGNISTTDTVIKVSLPHQTSEGKLAPRTLLFDEQQQRLPPTHGGGGAAQ